DRIVPGSLVPHGTAAEGGSSLSVTEFGNQDGEVVYWPQVPGGAVYQRTPEGYLVHKIDGGPEQFKQKAFDMFGKPVSIWIGEQPPGTIKKVSILRDKKTGSINLVVNQHENGLTFHAHNLRTPFQSNVGIHMASDTPPSDLPLQIDVSEDRKSVSLTMPAEGDSITTLNLDASTLDKLIYELSRARADLLEQTPVDGPISGQEMSVQIDPAWRTDKSPISNISGIFLRLRHLGYGWLGFILPHHEATALGKWLQENSERNDVVAPKT
ncbi:hypothetical protein, partial [Bradyrhizobium sp.]|uniref:hypothetical protein n=1 Tax=Bradyrhizobium sp. TaxID=376 RepID=UPI003D14EB25